MRRRDDSGATAVLVAILATFLVGMLAFTADLGVAFANKRQMQTAADAAALGAAGVFAQTPGNSCDTIVAAGASAAEQEARDKETANEPLSGTGTSELTFYDPPNCDDDEPVVRTTVGGNSPNLFGGVIGQDDSYGIFRSAAAVVEAATRVGAGLRPLAVCSKDLTMGTYPSPVMKLSFPESGHTSSACPDSETPGNWWTLDCPEDNGNDLATNIAQGCDDPVSIVPGQPDPPTGEFLNTYCADPELHPESCLRSNPGNVRDNNSEVAFNSLIASKETFFLPVFCGVPQCDPQGISDDGGGNVIYPVHKLIAVQLCGFHFGPKKGADMTGLCTNNPSGYTVDVTGPGAAQANFLLAVVVQVQVSGGTAPSGCRIGDPCDTGLRQVRMVDGGFDY